MGDDFWVQSILLIDFKIFPGFRIVISCNLSENV